MAAVAQVTKVQLSSLHPKKTGKTCPRTEKTEKTCVPHSKNRHFQDSRLKRSAKRPKMTIFRPNTTKYRVWANFTEKIVRKPQKCAFMGQKRPPFCSKNATLRNTLKRSAKMSQFVAFSHYKNRHFTGSRLKRSAKRAENDHF